ncbi:MAG: hypothetical protein RMI94_05225 [Bryobacterales bacterium]|nr:hypothetical protein [Bryobacteraceae bacterium]MDW8129930.1 hypothetical protein [Bryobacterales bacterium]
MRSRSHSLAAWLPSLGDLAFLMPAVFLFVKLDGARFLLGDGDTGWHIRTGEWILAHGRVPDRDLFSFTKAGETWYAWEWLWDVIFGWLHLHWGMAAVVWASLLVLCICGWLLYRMTRERAGDSLIAIAVTFLALAASSIHWLARPHLFTLLFVLVFYAVLQRVAEGRTRLLAWLPPLTILWTNLHGGFFVGILLIGTYAAGELLARLLRPEGAERHVHAREFRLYAATAVACGLASLVNPYGWRLHAHIVRYLAESYHRENIIEFLSISFHHPAAIYFEILLAAGAVAALLALLRGRYAEALLVLGWAHLALLAARNIPIYAFLSAPVIAAAAKEALDGLRKADVAGWLRRAASGFAGFASEITAMDRAARAPWLSVLGLGVVGALMASPAAQGKLRAEYDPKRYPAAAVDALGEEFFTGKVFSDDEWGDYLIYRLFPKTRVYIDGRSDFYGAELGKEYWALAQVRWDWQSTLERRAPDLIVLRAETPLASLLKGSGRWQLVYDDGIAIVFRRAGAEARQVQVASREAAGVIVRSRNHNPAARGARQEAQRGLAPPLAALHGSP